MPSNRSAWLISLPGTAEAERVADGLTGNTRTRDSNRLEISEFPLPSFKTGTLDSLIGLSEALPRQDAYFATVVRNILDTLRDLSGGNIALLKEQVRIDDVPIEGYLFGEWHWNERRYSVQKSLPDLAATMQKEMGAFDNMMKRKIGQYNTAKSALIQSERARGNFAKQSLIDSVSREHFTEQSEYLETLLIAVPKEISSEWTTKYERLSSMIVPRSSTMITTDGDYTIFTVVIFKRVRDEFVKKCREKKFMIRDMNDAAPTKKQELEDIVITERELRNELLRLARTNFSEAFQVLVHLKVLRLFVESLLRYGLPAQYVGLIVRPNSKSPESSLRYLTNEISSVVPKNKRQQAKSSKDDSANIELPGEYQPLMEQEFFDFVLFEVPLLESI